MSVFTFDGSRIPQTTEFSKQLLLSKTAEEARTTLDASGGGDDSFAPLGFWRKKLVYDGFKSQATVNFPNCVSVCYSPELNLFVALSNGGYSTSPDGVTWTNQASIDDQISWTSICWSPRLKMFCAVGESNIGDPQEAPTQRIATSSTGIGEWNLVGPEGYGDNEGYNSIVWAPEYDNGPGEEKGLFCAISSNIFSNNYTEQAIISSDGVNWTKSTGTPNPALDWSSLEWSPELKIFCAVANNPTDVGQKVMTSSDGLTWTRQDTPSAPEGFVGEFNPAWSSISWSPSLKLFCVVSSKDAGNRYFIMTSPNGEEWELHELEDIGINKYPSNSITWSPSLKMFCATVSEDAISSNILLSIDGKKWTKTTVGLGGDEVEWTSVCWSINLGIFCMVGKHATKGVATSQILDLDPL